MGCSSSQPQDAPAAGQERFLQKPGNGTATSNHRKLNQQLSAKARHPSAIPGSFAERELAFRQQHRPKKVVPERRQGSCRLRLGTLGGWKEGWCALDGSRLRFFEQQHAVQPASPPLAGATPSCSWELVGAHLRLERHRELMLVPAGGGTPVTLDALDAEAAQQWMVGLATVPGLFRRVQDYYEVGPAWGRGATCVVHECVGRYTGQRHALKSRLHRSRAATEAMHNELRILQICAKKPHPAIPLLHDYFFDEDGSIDVVMDLMEGGELFDHIAAVEQLREHEARSIFKQVAEGVAHLHSLGIAHRDLKPQNLMYASADEGAQVRIMDYDLAKVNYAPDWQGTTPCGTIHYMAPEVVAHQRYSLAVDMWSLGVILYIILTGRMPFDGKNREAIAAAIEAGRYRMDSTLFGGAGEDAQDLVRSLLQVDPARRLTAGQVLAHPWLTRALDPATSAELSSPMELRSTLSKTERGRQLLAIAALAYSEGDVRRTHALPPLLPNLPRLLHLARNSAGPSPVSAAGEALDFDMQAVRDQANGGGAGKAGIAASNPDRTAESDAVATLRSQLRLVGTAAGLQDRAALEAQGEVMLGGSPRAEQDRGAEQLAGRPKERGWGGGFDDLEADEVEEVDLSEHSGDTDAGSEARGGASRRNSDLRSGHDGAASRGQGPEVQRPAPLQLRLPPRDLLPSDQHLLTRLGAPAVTGRQRAQPAAAAVGSASPHSLKRHQSAYDDAAQHGRELKVPQLHRSSSWVTHGEERAPTSPREPVTLAMQEKQRRLERMRTASPSMLEWRRLTADKQP